MALRLEEGTVRRFDPGKQLVTEGDSSRKMFIIQKGKARVYKTYFGRRVTLAILGEGEVFGEMSFFDAAPRCASVEALTELHAVVLDGANAENEIGVLPAWVFPIFRTTFQRFRDADQKITVLQSMNEFQRKAFKTDNVGKTIYLELLRFIKTLRLLHYAAEKKGPVKSTGLYEELDEVLGERKIGLRVFWRQIKENGMIVNLRDERDGIVEFDLPAIDAWNEYLTSEAKKDRFLLLSHTAVAILRRLVGQGIEGPRVDSGQLGLTALPFYDESIDELAGIGLIRKGGRGDFFVDDIESVHRHFMYQDMIKAYDHTTMSIE